jgi:hypothetical protein
MKAGLFVGMTIDQVYSSFGIEGSASADLIAVSTFKGDEFMGHKSKLGFFLSIIVGGHLIPRAGSR